MGRSRMLHRWLAHVRSRLVGALRRTCRLPVVFRLGRTATHVVRDVRVLLPRGGSVVARMRRALPLRRRSIIRMRLVRCVIVTRRLSLVHMGRRVCDPSIGFRRRVLRSARRRTVRMRRYSVVVGMGFILPCRWLRDVVVGMRTIIVRGIWMRRLGTARAIGVSPLGRLRHIVARTSGDSIAGLSLLRGTHCRIICHWRVLRCNYACTVEGTWFRSCRYFRPAVVNRRPLRAIVARQLFMLGLNRSRTHVSLACRSFLGSTGPGIDSTLSPVIANTIHSDVIHRGVIRIVNISDIHAINRTVVVEISAVPITALIAVTVVAIPVVNAAIKAYLGTPVSGIPHVGVSAPSPIARRP